MKITINSVPRSKKAMIEAFLYLIQNNEYEKITITDICKKADVVRKTFYNHFKSKDAIVRFLIDIMFYELEERVDLNSINLRKILWTLYSFIINNKDSLFLFHKRGLIGFAIKGMSEYAKKQEILCLYAKQFVTSKADKYIANYISAVLTSIVETWINNNFTESVDFLVHITESFFNNQILKKQ
jgi:AcrR family transcriptional regulator